MDTLVISMFSRCLKINEEWPAEDVRATVERMRSITLERLLQNATVYPAGEVEVLVQVSFFSIKLTNDAIGG